MKTQAINVYLALPRFMHTFEVLLEAIASEELRSLIKGSRQLTCRPADGMLFDLLSREKIQSPPYAALCAFGLGFAAHQGYWLRIDPVELLVDAGNIGLLGKDHLLLEQNEIEALLHALNGLLQQDGLAIRASAREEWYLQLPESPSISTVPWFNLVGKDIKAYLPTGPNHKWWHKLLTELQMLLFQHAVNTSRQNNNKPLANSVWMWGEGELTDLPLKEYATIWSDHSLVRGMTMLAGRKELLSPASFKGDIEEGGDYLITLNDLDDETIALITALLKQIQTHKIHRLGIHLGSGLAIHLQAPKRKWFNLFPRPLSGRG